MPAFIRKMRNTRDKQRYKFYVSNVEGCYGGFYLWPDGVYRSTCWKSDDDHAYYPSREEAQAVIDKYPNPTTEQA